MTTIAPRLFRPAVPAFLLLLVGLAIAPPAAFPRGRGGNKVGSSNAAGKSAPPVAAGVIHLRFWKTDLGAPTSLQLAWLLDGSSAPGKEVARNGPGFQFGDYVEVPAGRGTLEVRAVDADQVLVRVPADLTVGAYYTLLVTEDPAGTPSRAELLPDGGPATGDAKIRDEGVEFALRNLTPGLRDLRISLGEELTARFTAPDGLLRMRGLRAATYEVHTSGTDATGKPFEWTTEADFRRCCRATLLIYPDAYGRIRPRLVVDGAAGNAPEENARKP